MGMRIQQLKAFTDFQPNHFVLEKWYDLIFLDAETFEKKIIQIRRTARHHAFSKMNLLCLPPTVYVCTNEDVNSIQISIVEFLMLLRYIGVSCTDEFILKVEKEAKAPMHLPQFVFLDKINDNCKIYEIRPLIH